ncbi:MAG: GNAT family N-acetyltransferase [Ilumatobacter sp.]|nr:GNAT family N-acetyltransferase [Ilumatobacter sp.]
MRPLSATDASDVAALEAEARLAIADARGGAALLAGSPPVGDWSGHVGDPTRPTWVGTIDDVVVAVLSLAVEGAIARVQEVWVTPEARELGMGDELLATAVATARATGCTRLDGWALPGDRDTKNLYERAGITARLIVVSTPL